MEKVILSEDDLNVFNTKRDSLQRVVYGRLITMFMNKELIPGQVLNRRQLAEDMNVSVAPVLEALVLLEQEGFVSTLPRKGTIVSPAKDSDIFGHLVVREALEVEAASLYCGEKVRANYEELRAYAARMDELPVDSLEHAKMEIIFHASLVNLAGIKSLFHEFVRINRVGFFYKINTMRSTPWTESQLHVDLVDNLCTDNALKAEECIRYHIRSGKPWPSDRA